jgi:spore maturation protein CgeB
MSASTLVEFSWRDQLKALPWIGRANGWWKARLQEREAGRNLAHYIALARKGAVVHGDGLQAAVRERLARRGCVVSPKRKGELRIFLAYGVSNWERVLPKSLREFGEVIEFDWRGRGYDDQKRDWVSRREAMNREMLETFHAANTQRRIDVVVGYVSGHNTNARTLAEMGKAGACIINFCLDDKLHFPGRKLGGRYTSPAAIASAVDLNLTNARDSIVKYAAHGGLAMFWPEAGDPEVHRPYEVPFEFDVSFVGSCYGWRPKLISDLRARGIDVACFGRGWPNGSLSNEEVVRLFSRSRINLGFGGVGYSRRLLCLKARDFEVPMSGGLYLTQENPELEEVFDVGREIVTYRGAADCAETIESLLSDPARAKSIREAGRARCLREHTYERRWREVFELTGVMPPAEDPVRFVSGAALSEPRRLRILYCGRLVKGQKSLMRFTALKELGHEVVPFNFFECERERPRWLLSLRLRTYWGPGIRRMNASLLAAAQMAQPDLIWVDKGLFIHPGTLREIRSRTGAVLVNFNNDDPFGTQRVGWRWYLRAIPLYDFICTPRSVSFAEYAERGARKVIKFNWAYNPAIHKPQTVTAAERSALGGPIGFIGDYEPARAESIQFLARQGLPVRVWGQRWQEKCAEVPGLRIEGGPLWGEPYAKAICSFDICLGFLRKANRDLATSRSVEIPACGGFLLAERTAEHLALFEEGKEAEFFGPDKELLEKARFYLEHPAERGRIAARGRERCINSSYSEQEVLADILRQLNLKEKNRAALDCARSPQLAYGCS